MVRTCVDSALADLSYLEELTLISNDTTWGNQMVDKIQSCKLGLRFLRMLFWSLSTLEDTDEEIWQNLMPVKDTHEAIWGVSKNDVVFSRLDLEDANLVIGNLILDLQGRIRYYMLKFVDLCELLLQCSLRCNSFKLKLILNFSDVILENLKDLYKYKTDVEIILLKNQIEILEKKLTLLRTLLFLIPKKWRGFGEMREFKVVVHAFVHYSASLVFMYWVKEVDEEMATKLNLLLFDMLQRIKPCVPVVKAFYIRFLKEIKLGQLDSLLLVKVIHIFVDLLLENLVDILKDDFQILHESLMFVVSFLANPPDQHAKDKELLLITKEIEVLIVKDLYLVLSFHEMKGNFSQENKCLDAFRRKVELVKGKIRQFYGQIRDSFSYDFPKTNGLGFFNFLLQNLGFLKDKLKRDANFIPFAKHLIIKIEEELTSMRPYLNDLFEQQKEQKELKDTWLKVLNLAYQTEYAINSCSVIGHQPWYNMARLMEMLDEIKVVKIEVKLIEGRKTQDGGALNCSTVALNKVLENPWALGFNEVIVGLEDEAYIIIEKLIYGSRFLDIVAIVGMAGLGKTTLANKVYNAHTVRHHFHMFAYCIVSQIYNARRILLDILGDIKGKDDKINDMMEEDLADMLRKCLKGKRYLIIMDDIWDVNAWDEIKISLPNDQNGSRVIFTTRNRYVPIQAKKDCVVHHLRFMSDEESWELLQKKAFHAEDCPPTFSEVGKMIAKSCKGLPLTIVLIAGVLAKTERSLSWWNKISEKIGFYVSTEDCMDVLELSYQHLPEHLKPCLLYFGAFAEDTIIRVNKLILLWTVEGFVLNSNNENLEIVAKEYLCDLVDRSLIIANERSSYGGIKSCRIHDQVHEFCQRKAQDENFLQFMDEYEDFKSSSSIVHHAYRVCIHTYERYYAEEVCPRIRSLLSSRNTYSGGYDFVRNLKLVQVMDLKGLTWMTWNRSFIKELDSLVHMRFIATSVNLLSLGIVPSISNLWNLEILILTFTHGYLKLPGTIWKMTRLRHVDVGLCYLSDLGVKKREAYPQMVNLESFSSPTIFSLHVLEDLIQRSPSLRKLSFQYVSREDFHFSKLYSLRKLESVKISSATNLRLTLFNFPSFCIKKLSLSKCFLDWIYLPEISKMPCLEVLKLLDYAFSGLKWNMEDTKFPKLKFLKLRVLELAEWIAFSESFPSLEVLIVNRCFYLNAIPPCFGEMITLKRIEVYASHKVATSVVEIQETQKDFGNEELEVIVSDSMYRK